MNDWSAYPVGAKVRCRCPDDFLTDVARKLRDRIGTVERHQQFSGKPIVNFPPVGRRKQFTWVPPSPMYIEPTQPKGE